MFGVQLLSGAYTLMSWIWKAYWYLERIWYQTINYQPEPEPAGPAPAPFLFFRGRPHNISLVRNVAAPFLEIEDEPEFSETLDTAILEADAEAWAQLFAVPPGAAEALRDHSEGSADLPLRALEDQVRHFS